jgi:4-amino-4-deoxy-L-arabinose transferase-like glycosyltransferase
MQPERARSRFGGVLLATAAVIIGCRVWLAVEVPLTDTTESRYGEMARKMVETGNWLIGQHDYGVPYLAKPPLALWLSAIGIELFGPNSFAPRLLILIVGLGFLVYFYRWVTREVGPGAAATGVLAMMGSLLYFVSLAAVMTDLVLVVCVTVALLAFWQRMQGGPRSAEWVFFIAIGLGLLTKGPFAAFLVIAPIGIWALLCRRIGDVWRRIAWIRGGLITAVVAVPWYAVAEWKYPGFLQYFIVGENISRFLVADWKGDRYGPVHEVPHGMIWLFLFFGALPWSIIGTFVFVRMRAAVRQHWRERRELAIFSLAAAAVPMLLFTAGQNVIMPYALPALVPAVLAAVVLLGESTMTARFVRGTALIAGATAIAFVVLAAVLHDRVEAESDRELVAHVLDDLDAPVDSLYYWTRYYSADYYSQGRLTVLEGPEDISHLIASGKPFYLAMKADRFEALPPDLKSALQPLGNYSKKTIYGPVSRTPSAIAATSGQ